MTRKEGAEAGLVSIHVYRRRDFSTSRRARPFQSHSGLSGVECSATVDSDGEGDVYCGFGCMSTSDSD